MAWLDDRAWCHPKVADLSDLGFRAWVSGILYSCGFGTNGVLTAGVQRQIGAARKVREELVSAGLWEPLDDDAIAIHDWAEHNGKRDAKRSRDRERQALYRAKKRLEEEQVEKAAMEALRAEVARLDGTAVTRDSRVTTGVTVRDASRGDG